MNLKIQPSAFLVGSEDSRDSKGQKISFGRTG